MFSLLPTLAGKADPAVVRAIQMLDARWRQGGELFPGSSGLPGASGAPGLAGITGADGSGLSIGEIQHALEVNGGAALDVTGLTGILAQPQPPGVPVVTELPPAISSNDGLLVNFNGALYYLNAQTEPGQWIALTGIILFDTHANRIALAKYAPASLGLGAVFYETDRTSLYIVQSVTNLHKWVFMMNRPYRAASGSRPADLGVNDVGFIFDDTNGCYQRWGGSSWFYFLGVFRGTHAARPAAANANPGAFYIESDRGDQVYRWEIIGPTWQLVPGWGGPLSGALSGITGGLGAADAGFRYYASDFDREFTWGGAAWGDSPGQPARGMIVLFDTVGPGTGWAACNGTNCTMSTSIGGTQVVATPDLNTNSPFLRGASASGSGTFGAAGAVYHYSALQPYIRL